MNKPILSIAIISVSVLLIVAENIIFIFGAIGYGKILFLLLILPVTIIDAALLWLIALSPKKLNNRQLNILYIALSLAYLFLVIGVILTSSFVRTMLGWIFFSLVGTKALAQAIIQYRDYRFDLSKNSKDSANF